MTDHLVPMPLEFTPGGILFDCDGTLVDTMPLHYRAWRKTLDDAGHPSFFPETQFYSWAGVPAYEILERLSAQHGVALALDELTHIKEMTYRSLIPELQPIPAVIAEVERFSGVCPLAVVSGGLRLVVEESLDIVGIRHHFGVIVGSNEVKRGKPEPDGMLLAAETLGVAPESCVVFEDADAGLEAARRAGMRAVDIRRYIG